MAYRYKLSEEAHAHPWRKMRAATGTHLVPALQYKRGVMDTETKEFVTEPATLHASQYHDVRRYNELPPLSTQKVRGILKRANITFSTSHSTRVRGWHDISPGVTVRQAETGTIHVDYIFDHWAKDRPYKTVLASAFAALQAAGLNPTRDAEGLISL